MQQEKDSSPMYTPWRCDGYWIVMGCWDKPVKVSITECVCTYMQWWALPQQWPYILKMCSKFALITTTLVDFVWPHVCTEMSQIMSCDRPVLCAQYIWIPVYVRTYVGKYQFIIWHLWMFSSLCCYTYSLISDNTSNTVNTIVYMLCMY